MSERKVNRRIDKEDLHRKTHINPFVGFAIGLVVLLIVSVVIIDRLFQPILFQVETVRYLGYFERVSPEEIEAAVLPEVAGNILSIDLDALEEVVEGVPWVSSATIRKRWPATLEISFSEHRPAARWASGGCVTAQGTRISGEIGLLPETMPMLSGPDDFADEILERYKAWGTVLAGVGLSIEYLELTPRGAWQARLRVNDTAVSRPAEFYETPTDANAQHGVHFDLLVGRNESNARVARFSRVYRHALFPRVAWVDRVDLRHTNGFAVKWIDGLNQKESDNGTSGDEFDQPESSVSLSGNWLPADSWTEFTSQIRI